MQPIIWTSILQHHSHSFFSFYWLTCDSCLACNSAHLHFNPAVSCNHGPLTVLHRMHGRWAAIATS